MLNRNLNSNNIFTKGLFLLDDRGHESGSSDLPRISLKEQIEKIRENGGPKKRSRNIDKAIDRIYELTDLSEEVLDRLDNLDQIRFGNTSNESSEILKVLKDNNRLLRRMEKRTRPRIPKKLNK